MSAENFEYETLDVAVDGHVATVTLNRPTKLNAMNGAMFREIGEAFRKLDTIPAVRAIILNANGKHFTAGLDLKESGSVLGGNDGDPARVREKLRRHILFLQDCFTALEETRAPVIACIHGACLGGGIDLISAADMRVCTEDAYFTIQEVNVGIVADVGTLQRMPHHLPQGILRELSYTGRKFTSAEADKYGFVNRVLPTAEAALDTAKEMAQLIASKSPLAVSGTKAVLNHSRDHTVRDGLDYVATWNSGQLLGEDLMKAASAALTRQEVEFADLLESDD
ncbi:crotonase/enoyl-CoA hydratase family protein [Kordiimonas sp. SCSIO 12603]|uniref:crotonase/enoyl-CoA hydratase family protein n=1 Tax=Kordiimonas sp. SCSIO 12603 TaxID=2829596 RepID=UPI0021039DE4|nr:crotonase/enoyl-CoA hydratase family protein [Kordiimonas sp. SCSIO 12603]UTW58572.1 crotonase/enoyl-CoA hydratase family protein [Kordiimonas sp. SCSIO 12603]